MSTVRLDVLGELDRAGAILLNRHFVYKSAKHGSGYINMDPLFADVKLVSMICAELVRPFRDEFDTVAGPAMGGTVLAFASACQVTDREVSAVWADKDANGFAFERAGFVARLAGKRVLVVEDLLTTGGSVISVCDQVRRHDGRLIGVSTICNRGGLTAAELGVPRLEALASVSFEAVDPDACSLCATGIPIVEDIGHGAEYRDRNPGYKGGYTTVL